ncbi:hypothetical protein [Streptomyces sp. NPDC058045]|uniref:hypothetical protein n=1 Tax=Streptomyces sp. NPDC058045 TaxID=3346311 RepID=UPI0036ECF67B
MIAIVAGVVVLLVGLGWFGWWKLSGGSDSSFPEARFRLTVPQQLLDGDWKLAQDRSSRQQEELEGKWSGPNVRDLKATAAQYRSTSDGAGVLVVSGMSGRLKDPDRERAEILRGTATAEGATVEVSPADHTPKGSDVTVTCQVVSANRGAAKTSFPECAWGDGNTAAAVAVITAEVAKQDPRDIDLDRVAEQTLKIRSEMRRPIG